MFNQATIDRMRAIHLSALMDRCLILPHTPAAVDGYGLTEPATYPEPVQEIPCLFHLTQDKDVMGQSSVPMVVARLRLPLGTVIGNKDRVKLTLLHGDDYSRSQIYEVVGEPRQRYTGLVVDLKLATR